MLVEQLFGHSYKWDDHLLTFRRIWFDFIDCRQEPLGVISIHAVLGIIAVIHHPPFRTWASADDQRFGNRGNFRSAIIDSAQAFIVLFKRGTTLSENRTSAATASPA